MKDTPKFFIPKVWEIAACGWLNQGKSWQEEFQRKKDDKVGFCRPMPGSWQDIKSGNMQGPKPGEEECSETSHFPLDAARQATGTAGMESAILG